MSAKEKKATICALSFSPETTVTTPDGAQAIGTLAVGDMVTAYDPQTGHPSPQTVEHVWINHDRDLLDVTLHDESSQASVAARTKTQQAAVAAHGAQAPPTAASIARGDETIHTTERHPWLTTDRGWQKAGDLQIGERVMRLDGTTAIVVGLHRRVGEQANYYNLTVSHLHTYAVGAGQFVAHKCDDAIQMASSRSNAISQARAGVKGYNSEDIYESDLNEGAGNPKPNYSPSARKIGARDTETGAEWREDPYGHNDFTKYADPSERPWWHDYGHVYWRNAASEEGDFVYGIHLTYHRAATQGEESNGADKQERIGVGTYVRTG